MSCFSCKLYRKSHVSHGKCIVSAMFHMLIVS